MGPKPGLRAIAGFGMISTLRHLNTIKELLTVSDDDSSPRAPISPLRKWTIRLVVWALLLTPLLLWPKVVGGALLALIIFAAALWYFIKWKFRKWFGRLGDAIGEMTTASGPFPLLDEAMVLLPATDVKLHHPRDVIGYRETLNELGFEGIGSYQVEKVDDFSLTAFCHPEMRLWAVVYDFESECAVDVLGRKSDGSFFAATNNVPKLLLENVRNAPVACCKDGDVAGLVEAAEGHAEASERAATTAESFSDLFSAYMQARRIWLFGDCELQAQRQKALRVAFLEQSGWTALEWDQKQDRVFFVHDESEVDSLAYQLLEMTGFPEEAGDEDDEEEDAYDREWEAIRELLLRGSLRANFRAQLEARELQENCPLIMRLEEPVPADVYVSDREVD